MTIYALLRWGLIGFVGGMAVTLTRPSMRRTLNFGGDAALYGTIEAVGWGVLLAGVFVTIIVLIWVVTGWVP